MNGGQAIENKEQKLCLNSLNSKMEAVGSALIELREEMNQKKSAITCTEPQKYDDPKIDNQNYLTSLDSGLDNMFCLIGDIRTQLRDLYNHLM
jgi:hypothetical protein